jgi:hypothetical protein
MLVAGVMHHLAQIPHIERLTANRADHEVIGLGFNRWAADTLAHDAIERASSLARDRLFHEASVAMPGG